MIDVNVCPSCTEFECPPKVIKRINKKGFIKYKCPRCGIEFEYKVTREPDYKNYNKDINVLTAFNINELLRDTGKNTVGK